MSDITECVSSLPTSPIAAPSRHNGRPYKVLLVDDDTVQRTVGDMRFREAGFDVETAASGEEALDKLKHAAFDAIVSDVVMAGLDGFSLCSRVREQPTLSAIPVLLLSAHYGDRSDRELARHVGASALVTRTANLSAEIAILQAQLANPTLHPPKNVDASLYEEHLRVNADRLAKLAGQAEGARDRYRAVFDNANDTIGLATFDGTIVDANRKWGELLGAPTDQIIGRNVRDFAPPEHETSNAATHREAVDKGEIQAIMPIRRADGRTFFIDFSSRVVSVEGQRLLMAIGRDVTDRVVASKALEAAERKYRQLVERIPDVVWTADKDGRYTFLSPNVLSLTGFTPEEKCSEDVECRFERIHPSDRPRVREAFDGLLQNGKSFDVEYRCQGKDGTWIWMHNRAEAGGPRDDAHYAEGVLTNITEKRHLEEQLRHAQKMDAVGRLAGGIAHDFNNMLNVLLGYTVMLLEDIPESHPMRASLLEMKHAGERSAELTRQLLAFSRQQPQAPRVLALNHLIAGMETLVRRLVGEDVEVITRLADAIPDVKVDPGQIEQVVMNLVVNARDAMPDGGKLTLETSVIDCDAEYAALRPDLKPGRYAVIAVSDTGIGMDSATQSRVFEPFYTTKEVGKGTGLGLSIVFGIVQHHGGHIWLYSELGKGTTFRVFLPTAVTEDRSKAAGASTRAESLGSETILLVEDEEQVRTFVRSVLARSGYRVLTASNPVEALRVCEGSLDEIDLLLTDVIMPHGTGRQLANELRAKRPSLKVLYISGYTDHIVVDHGVDQGMEFLQKPVMPQTLSRKVRATLDSRM